MAEDEEIQVVIEGDDVPAQAEVKAKETPIQTPEEGIAELKNRLENERKARLEAERLAKQYQASAANASQEVQDSNLQLLNGAIDKLKRESDFMRIQYRDAMSSGDYDAAAQIQEGMSTNAAKLLQLENGKSALEERISRPQQKQIMADDPVEQAASTLSPRSADWVRRHPEYIRDQRLFQKMVGAHNLAVGDGYVPDSDAYFQFIESTLGVNKRQQAPAAGQEEVVSAASQATQKRSAPPSAPTTRMASASGTGKTVIRLSSEMREMAQMMGMTPEEYAKNMSDLKKEGKLN